MSQGQSWLLMEVSRLGVTLFDKHFLKYCIEYHIVEPLNPNSYLTVPFSIG